ncbi:MAG TPA: hypothetical protein VF972_11015 [Actinomycetota bacterium]
MSRTNGEPDLYEVTFKLADGREVTVEVSSGNAVRAERRARLRFAKLHPSEAFRAPATRVTRV